MDKVNRFFELKERWKQSSEANRSAIDEEIANLLDSMTEVETERLTAGIQQDFDKIRQEAATIEEQLTIRERLEPVLPYLSVSNLAKDYFGKSSSWFYQRLNGNMIHGKVCRFTKEELNKLHTALKDISNKINSLSIQY